MLLAKGLEDGSRRVTHKAGLSGESEPAGFVFASKVNRTSEIDLSHRRGCPCQLSEHDAATFNSCWFVPFLQ